MTSLHLSDKQVKEHFVTLFAEEICARTQSKRNIHDGHSTSECHRVPPSGPRVNRGRGGLPNSVVSGKVRTYHHCHIPHQQDIEQFGKMDIPQKSLKRPFQ